MLRACFHWHRMRISSLLATWSTRWDSGHGLTAQEMSEQFFLSFLARLLHCSVTPAGFLSPQLPGSANPCCACCVALRFSSFSATFAIALSVSQVAHPVPHGMPSDPLSGELHDSGAFTICKKAPTAFQFLTLSTLQSLQASSSTAMLTFGQVSLPAYHLFGQRH